MKRIQSKVYFKRHNSLMQTEALFKAKQALFEKFAEEVNEGWHYIIRFTTHPQIDQPEEITEIECREMNLDYDEYDSLKLHESGL